MSKNPTQEALETGLASLGIRLRQAGSGTPRAMTRACGYGPATVVKATRETADSGLLDVREDGRHTVSKLYQLLQELGA